VDSTRHRARRARRLADRAPHRGGGELDGAAQLGRRRPQAPQHLGEDFTTLCQNIQQISDDQGVTLDWRVIGGVPYEVTVGSGEGEIRLVRKSGELVEAEEDEDPFAHGHDFVPLGQGDVEMGEEHPAQLKVDFERDDDLGDEPYTELLAFVNLFVLAHPMVQDLLYGNDVDVLFRFEPDRDQDACGTTKVLVEGETSDLVQESIDLIKAGATPQIRIIVREGDDMQATLLHEMFVHALRCSPRSRRRSTRTGTRTASSRPRWRSG
jgi:hypothetical protein